MIAIEVLIGGLGLSFGIGGYFLARHLAKSYEVKTVRNESAAAIPAAANPRLNTGRKELDPTFSENAAEALLAMAAHKPSILQEVQVIEESLIRQKDLFRFSTLGLATAFNDKSRERHALFVKNERPKITMHLPQSRTANRTSKLH